MTARIASAPRQPGWSPVTQPEHLVSVIVPVHNVEAYLVRCVNSLLAQTHRSLEILLVDDGSTDGSGAICDLYAGMDSRVRVLHQANGGLSAARNRGLDEMSGEYVTFVDSDDWVSPIYVETLLGFAICEGAQAVACHFVRTTTDVVASHYESHQSRVLTPDEVAVELLGSHHTMWTIACAKLYNAGLWHATRFPEGRLHEDEFTIYRVLDQSPRTVATTDALYYYFQRPTSISGRVATSGQRRDALDAARGQADYIRSGPSCRHPLLPRALGQLFRKQIYLCRQLRTEGKEPDPALLAEMHDTAAQVWRLQPGRPFGVFAQAYVRAPGIMDLAHRTVTAVRGWRQSSRTRPHGFPGRRGSRRLRPPAR